MKKIVIIGGKGTAVVIAEQIKNAISKFNVKLEVLGFAFDDESFGEKINGIPIVAKTYDVYGKYKDNPDVFFIFSLYRSDLIEERIALRDSYGIPSDRFINFIHPLATVADSAEIGIGNVILANTVVNPNVKLGNFNTFNSNALVGHDTEMGNSNFIAGHTVIGSNLRVGDGNFFGLNSAAKNFIRIGNYNIIGMAANVLKSVESKKVLVGNPAKELRVNG